MFNRNEKLVKIEIWVETREEAETVVDVIGDAEGDEIDFSMGVQIIESD